LTIRLKGICLGGDHPTDLKKAKGANCILTTEQRDNAGLIDIPVTKNGVIINGFQPHYGLYLVCIDIDIKEHLPFDHLDDAFKDTMLQQTGSDGYQAFFFLDHGLPDKACTHVTHPLIKEIDRKCEGKGASPGLALAPGTKLTPHKNPYRLIIDKEPKHITTDQYRAIWNIYACDTCSGIDTPDEQPPTNPTTKKPRPRKQRPRKQKEPTPLRQYFIKIIDGDYIIDKAVQHDTNQDEHLYWQALFREIIACGHQPEDYYDQLEQAQPEFNREETIEQLKYLANTNRRPSKQFYNRLFPLVEASYEAPDTEPYETGPAGFKERDEYLFQTRGKDFIDTQDQRVGTNHIIATAVVDHEVGHDYAWLGDLKGKFIRYQRGKWHENVEVPLNTIIRRYARHLGIPYNTTVRNEIKEMVKEMAQYTRDQFDTETTTINFKNGVYDTVSGELYDHPPLYPAMIQVPHEYDPDAPPPTRFNTWLMSMLGNDQAKYDTILQAIGLSLTTDVGFQKIIILKGPPKAGKGTLLNIVVEIVGHENVSQVSLHRLARRFGTSGILHKLVNVFYDLNTGKDVENEENIKVLIDEYIDYEVKGGDLGRVKNVTIHWFSTNKHPHFKNADTAIARRFVIIDMENEIDDTNVVKDIEQEWLDGELSGIIKIAIDAHHELVKQGWFRGHDARTNLHKFWMDQNPLYRFVYDECSIEQQLRISKKELRDNYNTWRADYDIDTFYGDADFSKELRKLFPKVGIGKTTYNGDQNVPVFYGIGVKVIDIPEDTTIPSPDDTEEMLKTWIMDLPNMETKTVMNITTLYNQTHSFIPPFQIERVLKIMVNDGLLDEKTLHLRVDRGTSESPPSGGGAI
jgi:P4 family phage/plasmid primase-like protien